MGILGLIIIGLVAGLIGALRPRQDCTPRWAFLAMMALAIAGALPATRSVRPWAGIEWTRGRRPIREQSLARSLCRLLGNRRTVVNRMISDPGNPGAIAGTGERRWF